MPVKWFTSYFFYKTILDRRRYGTVRTAKICTMFLGIIIIIFMIASVVSAQVPDGWLKVKASFKERIMRVQARSVMQRRCISTRNMIPIRLPIT